MKPTKEELLAAALEEPDFGSDVNAVWDAIEGDRALQHEVLELRALAAEISEALRNEESMCLDPHRQSGIRMLAASSDERRDRRILILVPTAAAAIVVFLLSIQIPGLQVPEVKVASREAFSAPIIEPAEFPEVDPQPNAMEESHAMEQTPVATLSSTAATSTFLVSGIEPFQRVETESSGPGASLSSSPSLALSRFNSGASVATGSWRSSGFYGIAGVSGSVTTGSESYATVVEPDYVSPLRVPLSTFSIDVDTASYSNIRRFLTSGALPPPDAVRVEEMINYFRYNYRSPKEGEPAIAVHTQIAACPWEPGHRLARVAVQGRAISADKRPNVNLVFLVDVSGSMQPENKLPLIQRSLETLVGQLNENDRVALVTYAGSSGVVLESTPGSEKKRIIRAIQSLDAGGSTNGASGIQLAYLQAAENAGTGIVSRVILLTDGDFNVGVTSQEDLKALIKKKAKSGIFLSVLGFGMGNLKDSTLEMLSQNGNGQYGYIDSFQEAQRHFVSQLSGTLITIAKDVKLQVEFNPAKVAGYRLVGYENRKLADADFRDDKKDAGDMGAGQSVTALYEIEPIGSTSPTIPLRYQSVEQPRTEVRSDETLTVSVRYRDEATGERVEFSKALIDGGASVEAADPDFRFAASVASFGMLLRDSKFKGQSSYDLALELGVEGISEAPTSEIRTERAEYIDLVRKAKAISGR